ncbi:MAG: PD40 domain-containing protein [Bacteroidia bacterium]|nr:PD40 domain-containing protein [Bacteroidia bacterium]
MKILWILFFSFLLINYNGICQNDSIRVVELNTVNSDYDDFAPQLTDSVTLLFTSARQDEKTERLMEYSHNVYYIKKDSGFSSSPQKCSYLFNNDNHDGIIGSSSDRNTIYFYKTFNGGDIYFSQKKADGSWKSLKKLALNTEFHECSAVSSGDTLFFASNQPSGLGEHDIYISIKDSTGKWNAPENFSLFNSESDERFLFLSDNGEYLCFSSNRSSGSGGYDIYKSHKGKNGDWSVPELLPGPVNSEFNDISICITTDDKIFFASDRPANMKGYNLFLMETIKLPPKEISVTIPIVLLNSSSIEENKQGRIFLIKDSVTLLGPSAAMPDSITIDKSNILDSTDLVFVRDLFIDSSVTILDEPDALLTGIEIFPSVKDTLIKPEPAVILEPKKTYTLDELKEAINFEINICKVQVGTFINILSVDEFESKFPLLKGKVVMEPFPQYNIFYMKETCKELDCAAKLQKKCLFEYKSVSDTFIGVYSKEGERVLIYFDVDKNIYVIVKTR